MEINEFIGHFAEQFENTDTSSFTLQTNYNELDEWSSLTLLSVMAMVDEEYNVQLLGEDIRRAQTIGDLYDIVKSKL